MLEMKITKESWENICNKISQECPSHHKFLVEKYKVTILYFPEYRHIVFNDNSYGSLFLFDFGDLIEKYEK